MYRRGSLGVGLGVDFGYLRCVKQTLTQRMALRGALGAGRDPGLDSVTMGGGKPGK